MHTTYMQIRMGTHKHGTHPNMHTQTHRSIHTWAHTQTHVHPKYLHTETNTQTHHTKTYMIICNKNLISTPHYIPIESDITL